MISTLLVIFVLTGLSAQAQDGYGFEDIKRLETTSVKDQNRSGTCWSFSAISFLESELLRMGKPEMDLSEMWVVKRCYYDKAKKTVRLHGHLNFAPGGAFHDVLYVLENYSLVPEKTFPALAYGEDNHVHGEMDKVLDSYVDGVIENKNRRLTTAWEDGLAGILDAYLGQDPQQFSYDGNTYTPESFSDQVLGLDPNDYIGLASFTHQDYYSSFPILVPDNWLWRESYNLPLDEFMEVMYHAIDKGYTIAWGADVSEKGFSHRNGVAVVPAKDIKEVSGSERARWETLTPEEMEKHMYSFDGPVPEKDITPEIRQEAYDRWQTTDDHGMHIVGTAKDKNGSKYFIVKNSWAESNLYDGYFYASDAFVRYKTMNIMLHKDAVPKTIMKKLNK